MRSTKFRLNNCLVIALLLLTPWAFAGEPGQEEKPVVITVAPPPPPPTPVPTPTPTPLPQIEIEQPQVNPLPKPVPVTRIQPVPLPPPAPLPIQEAAPVEEVSEWHIPIPVEPKGVEVPFVTIPDPPVAPVYSQTFCVILPYGCDGQPDPEALQRAVREFLRKHRACCPQN